MLVIGAGGLARSVDNLVRVDPGFNRSRPATFHITLPPARKPGPWDRGQAFQQVVDRLRSVPGVQQVSAMSCLSPNRPVDAEDIELSKLSESTGTRMGNVQYSTGVMSAYFSTMGIRVQQGRTFEPADAASTELVTVVNEAFAKTFWKDQDPIGHASGFAAGTDPRGSE